MRSPDAKWERFTITSNFPVKDAKGSNLPIRPLHRGGSWNLAGAATLTGCQRWAQRYNCGARAGLIAQWLGVDQLVPPIIEPCTRDRLED
jgi:hypothetical protein